MTEPVTIEQIDLQGFRGFLKPQSIVVRKNRQNSLAIFAPNGNGKSSLVDALEYYFKEGKATLDRLGMKATDKKAGRKYVPHVSAGKNDMMVRVKFRQGNEVFEDSRMGDSVPNAAKRILPLQVSFIIRDYELREFVQENQYGKLVKWFNLQPLDAIQENLQTLKNKINNMEKNKEGENVLMHQLKTLTDHEFQTGNKPEVLKWLNEGELAKLSPTIKFKELTGDDAAFLELVKRSEMEQNLATTNHLSNLLEVIKDLFELPAAPQTEPSGLIVDFEKAVSNSEIAAARLDEVKSKASDHVFKEVWAKSQELLQNRPDLDACPVCETPFDSSKIRTRTAVLNHLHVNLDRLDEYDMSEKEKNAKEATLNNTLADLKTKLGEFFRWAGSRYQYAVVVDYNQALQSWKIGDNAPDSTDAVNALANLDFGVTDEIKTQSDESVYGNALNTVKRLFDLMSNLDRIKRTKHNLSLIGDSLDRQTEIINRAIVEHIGGLVDKLKDMAQEINQEIQGFNAPNHPIEIKLAKETKHNQRTAHIFTNFMNRGEDVPPNGVLSESQNRTLALAIRLAAISMFNTEFKVIVLDDIAMSYDEERRQHIAALLHKRFSEFQVIVVTHDSFFYEELRERFRDKWQFLKFEAFKDDYGPIIKGQKTLEMIVNEKIANGEQINGNEMRMAYEEWLNRVCAGFATLLPYVPGKRPCLSDLIESLGQFLKENGLKPPQVSGYSGNYLDVMKKARFVNITSHYNPHLVITSNELKTAWREFSEFKSYFKCRECGSDHLIKEQGKEPRCAKCGKEFAFVRDVEAAA